MPRTPRPKAADQFRKLGLTEADYTPAMTTAVKQRWTGLPVDVDMQTLRDRLAAVKPADVPDLAALEAELDASEPLPTDDAARAALVAAEHKRRTRNAAVNAWRERNQIQAALDARGLKFARMRAAKTQKVAS